MRFSLSLSGGGVRGAAHVGVLKALEEMGLKPAALSGTSAGAVIAALYAYGIPVKDLEQWVVWLAANGRRYIDGNFQGLARLIIEIILKKEITASGIIKGEKLEGLLCQVIGETGIEEVSKKLIIPAADLNSGKTIVFSNSAPDTENKSPELQWQRSGRLCRIVRASASVPGVFQPVEWEPYYLVDGGITNNLPVDLLTAAGEKNVLAVDVGSAYTRPKDKSIIEVLTHSFAIMSDALKECTAVGEKLLLRPPLPERAGLLSFEYMPECMEAGYQYTKKKIPQIIKVLS